MGQEKYGLIGVQLGKDATDETVAQIRKLENDDIAVTDQRESNRTNNTTYWASRIVCYGFLAIIAVITLFNIINSISMSVSARTKQYGAMRAVGMDNKQLTRMISAEAFTYAVSGLILGLWNGNSFQPFSAYADDYTSFWSGMAFADCIARCSNCFYFCFCCYCSPCSI